MKTPVRGEKGGVAQAGGGGRRVRTTRRISQGTRKGGKFKGAGEGTVRFGGAVSNGTERFRRKNEVTEAALRRRVSVLHRWTSVYQSRRR